MAVKDLSRTNDSDIVAGSAIIADHLDAEFDQLVAALTGVSVPDRVSSWPSSSSNGRIVINTTAEDLAIDDGTNVFGLNTIKVTGGAGGVSAFDTVYVSALGSAPTVLKASNAALATCYVLGIMMEAVAEGGTGSCRLGGPIYNTAWDWTGLGPIYLSTAGGLTQTAPSPAGGARVAVGLPLSADSMIVIPNFIFMEY